VFIKICGLTNAADALAAAEAGADAIGFVFAPSPRQVSPAQALAIAARIPRGILRVGVLVSPTVSTAEEIVAAARLDLVQIHGAFPEEGWRRLGRRAIRALRVGQDRPARDMLYGPPRYLLLDAYRPGLAGGTGEVFPWPKADAYRALGLPLLAAGGLHPGNVRAALDAIRPDGVDVSTGVEAGPGRKDPALMRALVAAVRAWEAEESESKHAE